MAKAYRKSLNVNHVPLPENTAAQRAERLQLRLEVTE
jgi:hypothetical protein